MYVISAMQLCISTKNVYPRKSGGTKHRAFPPLQKVWGTCPPVHRRIYAHGAAASKHTTAPINHTRPSLHKHSSDGITRVDIQLQLTTHLSTQKGWKA